MHEASAWLRLRLVVGYLGEKSQYDWWPTSFYEAYSRSFLIPTFPHTAHVAQYQGVCAAARLLHDTRVGVGNAFHLFRLPAEFEQDLDSILRAGGDTQFAVPHGIDAAIQILAAMESPGAVLPLALEEGPVLVGMWGEEASKTAVSRVATMYRTALQSGVQVFPYMTV